MKFEPFGSHRIFYAQRRYIILGMKYKPLIDLAPLVFFFAAYLWRHDMFFATKALLVSLYLALAADWLLTRKLNRTLLAVTLLGTVLGGITLAFHNPLFIKLKLSVVCGVLALAYAGSQFIGKQVLAQRLMQSAMTLPEPVWRKLNLAWAAFFAFNAALNYYVAINYSDAIWLKTKMFLAFGAPIIFVALQIPFLYRYFQEEPSTEPPAP